MGLNKGKLSHIVADTLGLPKDIRKGEAHNIVTAIIKVMTDALNRGEVIKIQHFGTFYPSITKPIKTPISYFSKDNKLLARGTYTIPPRRHVRFLAVPSIRRLKYEP